MSNPHDRPVAAVSGTVLIISIAGMFVAVVAAVVALAIGLPESQNPAGLAAQLLAAFATLVVALGALFKIGKVQQQVNESAEDTQRIVQQTNGQLDHRIRTLAYESTRRALVDHLDDDDAAKPPQTFLQG